MGWQSLFRNVLKLLIKGKNAFILPFVVVVVAGLYTGRDGEMSTALILAAALAAPLPFLIGTSWLDNLAVPCYALIVAVTNVSILGITSATDHPLWRLLLLYDVLIVLVAAAHGAGWLLKKLWSQPIDVQASLSALDSIRDKMVKYSLTEGEVRAVQPPFPESDFRRRYRRARDERGFFNSEAIRSDMVQFAASYSGRRRRLLD
jgi:hypothetical protein